MDTQLRHVWADCRHCGLLQPVPPPARGYTRRCRRCHESLGSGIVFSQASLALVLSALCLFMLAQLFPFMNIALAGYVHAVHIASSITAFADHAFATLAFWVLAIAVAAPLMRLLGMSFVLYALHHPQNHRRAIALLRLCEKLRPWAMLDVLLLAAVVASQKLRDMAQIELDAGFWALIALVAMLVAVESMLDRRGLWDTLKPPPWLNPQEISGKPWISCLLCDWVQPEHAGSTLSHCERCHERMHHRKPKSLQRTWALVLAGVILYVPANLFPVLITTSFHQETVSTIMGGVRQLMNGDDWPLAAVLFTASIVIPLLKLIGLAWLMLSIQRGSQSHLVGRTTLYHGIRFVGKWANVDIFVGALLTALVTLGDTATITPAIGAWAFGAVVVLTMLAAECFDSRLIWDAAGVNGSTAYA